MLHLLLVPQLRDINLSTCQNIVTRSIALTMRVQCRNLLSLNLHGCKQLPADALARLVESLPRLIRLDLSKTLCDTQVLSAIGSSCRQLRELNLSQCRTLSLTSLLYLAYDPRRRLFGCQSLQKLCIFGLKAPKGHLWALLFVLMALPRLMFLLNSSISSVLHLIYKQQFDHSRLPPGFPSLAELFQHRMKARREEDISRLTLLLREIIVVRESVLSVINIMCPYMEKATVFLDDRPLLAYSFLSWRHLTHLTIICDKHRNLSDLLPMMASLGAQLHGLIIRHFFLAEESSFHVLLSYCTNLQEFEGLFLPPRTSVCGRQEDIDTLDWDFSLPCFEFPQLSLFTLEYPDAEIPLPFRHAMVLRQSLVNVLKESPGLKYLTLRRLPFSLDRVFERVLKSPSTALRHIDELVFSQIRVSVQVVNLILSSENELSYLCLLKCPGISETDYNEFTRKVDTEGFDVEIMWKSSYTSE
uniref:F-box domain-containing protein n=2 Tax=Anolis carolinensis TaxID=28377 RepID=A0A803SLH3_ANOCA